MDILAKSFILIVVSHPLFKETFLPESPWEFHLLFDAMSEVTFDQAH